MILNLTQHEPTPEQVADGVGQPIPEVVAFLTFETLPDMAEVESRAKHIAWLAAKAAGNAPSVRAMIGGAPYLMRPLEQALRCHGIRPIYSYLEQVCWETDLQCGSVELKRVFRHSGWVVASW